MPRLLREKNYGTEKRHYRANSLTVKEEQYYLVNRYMIVK
jgi:hypothetical protein